MSDETVKYKKMNFTETIEVGDMIMLDLNSGNVTRALLKNYSNYDINSRLVIGVCTFADNETPVDIIIDCGESGDEDTELLDCGDSIENEEYIVLYSRDSTENPRETIQVVYYGQVWVNCTGKIHIGDRLCISRESGKVTSKEFLGNEFYEIRSIGKALKMSDDETQVKVLLDIE